MKILKVLLIIIGVLLLIGIVMGLAGPKSYHMERSTVINASPDIVWPYTNTGRTFQEWSPFRKMDTTATVEYFGTEGAIGSGFKWEGKKTGKGESTYTVIDPGKATENHLKFHTPFGVMESDSYIRLEPDPAGTKVTWGMRGENNFIGRIMQSMSSMDKAMGPVFEEGLNDLNTLVTSRSAKMDDSSARMGTGDFAGGKYWGVRGNIKMTEISTFYEKNLPAVMQAIQSAGATMAGMPSGLYYSWDEQSGMTDMVAAIGVQGDQQPPAGIQVFTIEPGRALMMKHLGGYSGLESAHMSIDEYMKANNLESMPPVIEEYVTDPMTEPDSTKWVTRITYILK